MEHVQLHKQAVLVQALLLIGVQMELVQLHKLAVRQLALVEKYMILQQAVVVVQIIK